MFFDLISALSDINIMALGVFLGWRSIFSWYNFVHLFIVNLSESLCFKFISRTQEKLDFAFWSIIVGSALLCPQVRTPGLVLLWEEAALPWVSRGCCGRGVCWAPGTMFSMGPCFIHPKLCQSCFSVHCEHCMLLPGVAARPRACSCELVLEFQECASLMETEKLTMPQGRRAAQGHKSKVWCQMGKLAGGGTGYTARGGCQVLREDGPRGVEVPGSLFKSWLLPEQEAPPCQVVLQGILWLCGSIRS